MRPAAAAAIATGVVLLDQLTKTWVIAAIPLGSQRAVLPGFFRLVHTRNRGIAFGLLGSSGQVVQSLLLAVVVAVVGVLIWQLMRGDGDRLAGWGLSLVLGGALGNLADRLLRGEVVDFLDVYVRVGGREHTWPTFNVADSCITMGAALVILAELVAARRKHAAPAA
jgi:signal peptidase II